MAVTVIATAGASNANSFLTVAEMEDIALAHTSAQYEAWAGAEDQGALVVMASRMMAAYFSGRKMLAHGKDPFTRIFPAWTGTPATTTQRLPWPRAGMFDMNGNALAENAIPEDLKLAVAELVLALASGGDTGGDNDAAAGGISSVKAGSVSVAFRADMMLTSKPLPDSVLLYLVPSWYTDEEITGVRDFDFGSVLP